MHTSKAATKLRMPFGIIEGFATDPLHYGTWANLMHVDGKPASVKPKLHAGALESGRRAYFQEAIPCRFKELLALFRVGFRVWEGVIQRECVCVQDCVPPLDVPHSRTL